MLFGQLKIVMSGWLGRASDNKFLFLAEEGGYVRAPEISSWRHLCSLLGPLPAFTPTSPD